jgi:predicted enzyme related to lactoylglutathione lyase
VTRAGATVLAEAPMTVVADPAGVAFCLTADEGVEVSGEPGSWAMSALHTPDVAGARAFYGAAFGWTLEPGTGFDVFRLGEQVVAVVTATDGAASRGARAGSLTAVGLVEADQRGRAPVGVPHWAINFAVRDVDAFAQRAAGLGATILLAPFTTPGFRNAVIADPQGGVLAISAAA